MEPTGDKSCIINSMRMSDWKTFQAREISGQSWRRMVGFSLLVHLALCGTAPADEFEFFEKKSRPVLVERCYKCHSADAEKLKRELLLDGREGMLKGGGSGKPAIV